MSLFILGNYDDDNGNNTNDDDDDDNGEDGLTRLSNNIAIINSIKDLSS